MAQFTFADLGECGLLVHLAEGADVEKLGALEVHLRGSGEPGILECAPGWESLLIHYNPGQITRGDLTAMLQTLRLPQARGARARWQVPVCFEPPYAQDMAALEEHFNLSRADLVARITSKPLTLAMYGFAPGFAYLRGLDKSLFIPRRLVVKKEMPAGSFIIAAGQAAIASAPMPTGWHIAGRTPLAMFKPEHDPPVLFSPGDELHLRAIPARQFSVDAAPERLE